MMACPRCQQTVSSQAITCPHCRLELKAYGHPGLPLYRASQDQAFLCQTCQYEADDTCTYPQRPYAKACILYCADDLAHESNHQPTMPSQPWPRLVMLWLKRHPSRVAFLGLIVISVLWALWVD